MKAKTYIKNVLKTESNDFEKIASRLSSPRSIRLLHGILGLCTEATELFEMLEKRKLDFTNLKEEVSDCHWYIAVIINEYKLNPEIIYQKGSLDPKVKKGSVRKQLNHHLDVLAKNVGLAQDLVKKYLFYGREYDNSKIETILIKILQDLATLCLIGKIKLEDSLEANIEKLKARFGDKFSETRANNRNLKKERKILEKVR